MRTKNSIEPVFSESSLPRVSARIYDLGERRTDNGRRRIIKALRHENALLTQMVSELETEITSMRELLERN